MAVSVLRVERRGVALEPFSQRSRSRARIQWLGQAGFLVDTKSSRFVIDPYLSNSLGIKYKGSAFPHVRMIPIPIEPSELRGLTAFFATHHHGDHLDGDTISALGPGNPGCAYIVPRASKSNAKLNAAPENRILLADAFSPLSWGELRIYPIPSAHEELSIDDAGHHVYLGYIISVDGLTIYHSGDCAPYGGLLSNLNPFKVDVALLPVNGRDATRKGAGILGNFSLDEAVALARDAGFGHTIGHHFGMFDFNTIDAKEAKKRLADKNIESFELARMDCAYEVE